MLNFKQFNLKEIIPALSLIIDLQANGNLYHGFRVAIIAYHLNEEIELSSDYRILYEGLLHDVGLFETGEHLAANYWDLESQKSNPKLRDHPILGASIIKEIPGMEESVTAIMEHHEYFDGSGYPFGKRREEISIHGQILRTADSLDIFLRRNNPLGLAVINRFIYQGTRKEFSPKICFALLRLDRKLLEKISDHSNIKNYFYQISENMDCPDIDTTEQDKEIILKIFSRAIDGKHRYTKQHSFRVAGYAVRIGEKLGLNPKQLEDIRIAGYLHDIGKIGIPNYILDKPGPLNDKEWLVIKAHPIISWEIVKSIKCFEDVYEIVIADQEEYDGSGYPNGLKGQDIPLGARIVLVADAVDAMLSDRAYRKALLLEEAIEELRKNSGTQFDPAVANVAIDFLIKEFCTRF